MSFQERPAPIVQSPRARAASGSQGGATFARSLSHPAGGAKRPGWGGVSGSSESLVASCQVAPPLLPLPPGRVWPRGRSWARGFGLTRLAASFDRGHTLGERAEQSGLRRGGDSVREAQWGQSREGDKERPESAASIAATQPGASPRRLGDPGFGARCGAGTGAGGDPRSYERCGRRW